ncbi:MAG: hypothetical protein JWQ72_2670 [Polaromonas sp.]|nr:hypothetical protein [Polaromonas sp.]
MSARVPLSASVDHLVVLAASLEEGAAWCGRVLGVTPGAGGLHPLMGTHNLLLNVSGDAFPRCYLEVIAVNPDAVPQRLPGHRRWFDMDDTALQARVARDGPQLVHFVARTSALAESVRALAAAGLDRGEVIAASRQAASGLLSWRIAVREDGQRLFYGGLPTLIQWGGPGEDPDKAAHPVDHLPACGLALEALQFSHPRPDSLSDAYAAFGLEGVDLAPGPPDLRATLSTPLGRIILASRGA